MAKARVGWSAVAVVVVAVVAAAATPSCGGDPVCGDGVREGSEQCDDGNMNNDDFCRNDCVQQLPETLDATISWVFNENAAPGFASDGCSDVGSLNVVVEITGPDNRTGTESCSLRQVMFRELPPGDYVARVRPLGVDDVELTDGSVAASFSITSADVMLQINVPFDAWTRSYNGTFFFRTMWGGADCATAIPPVAQHVLLLEQGGQPVALTTEEGDPLDGSAPGVCRSSMEEFPQSAKSVPWGPSTFTVVGLDGDGVEQFREAFDTFVGAGISNDTLVFDVDSLAPDAGVPDAGAPDASVPPPDAGMEPDAG